MKNYAVIRIKGKQYKVSEGEEVLVGLLNSDEPLVEVLLCVQGGKVNVGRPIVKNAKVVLKVVNEKEKGEKIHVMKYKAKSRYRKKIGFRALSSRLHVEKITV
ncbi:50S ribosomal protein L21 [Candidatus Woesebacteria bacterium RIFCSPHIGHO2_01_FULL_38_9]|uniref:Large ribosomal subunit protein bL21 n=2 Tax=Candidatus Woeseibacteriota TaxID=1752722 RepID=A0A1F7Y109_9BACT|nr:MAG: 50S ribosomal protein L21 [Candidatus Woesebacteria bacterium RIFCSPHIGHO2_01_FULL_38_9]OGM58307.1 MAG: 50S ribosomal protein L21 [Candidatus Woesebacteria bacterium RIFCSPLOWO2_01_FULL_39_10]